MWLIVGYLWGALLAVSGYGFLTGQPLVGVMGLVLGAAMGLLWWTKFGRFR
jgi:hypothetical protein